ncbi:SDR family NAD(P)-dependent oxidoreductase [Pelagibacterium lentulum]|uniref:Oxidoreductase n=1 Tax=Pelagibacterium lentulum TaxID=2029865 RepID=A0A916RC38_9HYPH|nr:SDR family NAD(P)-dependent oxidoreductase [Pelagibacterium lentulum]GGA51379.1 oxidoreductase [Pelagibacterium lentulum]
MSKTAWVLGGGSGIGAALVKELVARGWTVAISGRRTEPLQALAESHDARPYRLDVTDFDAVKDTVKQIAADIGKIDLVVFSVAAWEVTKPGTYDYESFRRIIDTNLLGAMRVIDPVVAQMRKQGFGEIALVASVAGYFGLPRSAAYSSGKSAMITLAETMRTELASDNISVRIVCPGFVKTDLTAKNDFPMPFLMEADKAGKRIADGLLNSKRFEIAFPTRFVLLLKLIGLMPYPIFFAIMKRLIARK